MRPVQQIHADDCTRAAIATLFELELEQVPDFNRDGPGDEWFALFQLWLENEHGLRVVMLDAREAAFAPPKVFHLATVISRRGERHMVVMYGENIVHDPWPHTEKGAQRGNPMRPGGAPVTLYLFVPIDIGKAKR